MKKLIKYFGVLTVVLLAVAACGKSSSKEADAETKKGTEIKVGTGLDALPYCYLNENDEYDGFDVQVVKAIDEKLTDYYFTFQGGDFPTTLSNLESDKVQMAAFEFEENAERKEKFIYGDVGYVTWDTYVVYDGDKSEVYDSLDDLKGKKVYVTTATNQAAMAEEYLKEHAGAFEIIYGEYNSEQLVQALQSGTVDATLAPKYQVDKYNESFSSNLKLGKTIIHKSAAYIIFNKKTDSAFIEAVNKAMKELKEDGTLKEISEKYLKGDYVPE